MELLIVIVILGVLAAVTVFAVRGITDKGEENACGVELRTLTSAQEVNWTINGSFADEAGLVSGGAMTDASEMYDVTIGAGGTTYSIVPATGSSCTQTASDSGSSGGGGGGGGPIPPAVTMPTGSFTWHGGVTAYRYPLDIDMNDEIVVLGRTEGAADWVSAHDNAVLSPRRTHFIDMDSLTPGNLTSLLTAINNNGVTALVLYPDDDTSPIGGYVDVADFLANDPQGLGAWPNTTLHTLDYGTGNDLAALMVSLTP